MSLLDGLLGVQTITDSGASRQFFSILDFGTGLDVAEDPTNSRLIISATAGAGAQNEDYKSSARLAASANHPRSGLAAVGGGTPIAGDRVLLPNQTDPIENGIYIAAVGAWSRATDADTDPEVTSMLSVSIEEGTFAGRRYQVTSVDPIAVGTDSIVFALASALSLAEVLTGGSDALVGQTINFLGEVSIGRQSALVLSTPSVGLTRIHGIVQVGAGTFATDGSIAGAHGDFDVRGRNDGDSGNATLMSWGASTTDQLVLGDSNFVLTTAIVAANQVDVFIGSGFVYTATPTVTTLNTATVTFQDGSAVDNTFWNDNLAVFGQPGFQGSPGVGAGTGFGIAYIGGTGGSTSGAGGPTIVAGGAGGGPAGDGGLLTLGGGIPAGGGTAGLINMAIAGATVGQWSAAGLDLQATSLVTTGFISAGGASPSATGTIRLAHASTINWRNSGNTSDTVVVEYNSGVAILGSTDSDVTEVQLRANGATRFSITPTLALFTVAEIAFNANRTSPLIRQQDDAVALTGDTLTVQAQSLITITGVKNAGKLFLVGGDCAGGSTNNGGDAELSTGKGADTDGLGTLGAQDNGAAYNWQFDGSNMTASWFAAPLVIQQDITGARDDPEGALADLLTKLDTVGIFTDSTTAT